MYLASERVANKRPDLRGGFPIPGELLI